MPKEIYKPLGRWGYVNCDKKTNLRVDLSNEDHCGPCGQYILTKKNDPFTIPIANSKP
jgi:hypothetical protein